MVEKLWEDASIHPSHDPQLLLEAGATDGPDRNKGYRMPMTSAWEIRLGRTALTLGT